MLMRISPFNWLALSFFGYYCAYGVFLPLFPAWLKQQAYDAETIGLLLASAYVFRFIGGIFFSGLIKRASGLIRTLRYLAWAGCLTMLLMGWFSHSFILLFGGLMLFSMVNAAGMPIGDSLATTWQQQIGLDYGKVRLIGSAAFVVGVVLFGQVVGYLGESTIPWIIAALLALNGILQLLQPQLMPRDITGKSHEASVGFVTLLKDPTTTRLLLAIALIQGSHAAYYAYSVLYWQSLGISVSVTGLLWGLSVIAEIALFFFSSRLFKNTSVTRLFYITGIASIVRWLCFPYADVLWEIALLQCMHSLTYVVGHYATVRYISTRPQGHIAKLQGLYNAIAACAAIALLTALSGVLYPIQPAYAFAAMAVSAALGLLITPRQVKGFLLREVN